MKNPLRTPPTHLAPRAFCLGSPCTHPSSVPPNLWLRPPLQHGSVCGAATAHRPPNPRCLVVRSAAKLRRCCRAPGGTSVNLLLLLMSFFLLHHCTACGACVRTLDVCVRRRAQCERSPCAAAAAASFACRPPPLLSVLCARAHGAACCAFAPFWPGWTGKHVFLAAAARPLFSRARSHRRKNTHCL